MIASYGLTDIGRHRSLNQDAILVESGLAVVCDGMGGHRAGEVASAVAVDAAAASLREFADGKAMRWPFGFDDRLSVDGNRLRTAVKTANRAVIRRAATSRSLQGMGTTISAALVAGDPPGVTVANVGDSRVYLVGRRGLEQLTVDDSWAAVALAAGRTVPPHLRNMLTKALGAEEDVEFEVSSHPLADGDLVLLCSDGLTNMVDDDRIFRIIDDAGRDPEAACTALVAAANENGGLDNVSAVLVGYTE